MANKKLPSAAGDVAETHPEIWSAYAKLGETLAADSPLSARERRLLKLGFAIGVGSEGAAHSHARRGMEQDGLTAEELEHAALLAITTLGFPQAVAALSWIKDVTRAD